MDEDERYQMVRSLFKAGNYLIIKENRPKGFKFLWKGDAINIRNAKKYLYDRVDSQNYTVTTEGYVKFKTEKETPVIEWDVRASKGVEKDITRIKWDYTKKACYITFIFVLAVIAIVIIPLLRENPSHGIGNLILAIIFSWIPPLTVYTVLDHLQSNLKYLGVENVAKKVEKLFQGHQDKLQGVRIKRYSRS